MRRAEETLGKRPSTSPSVSVCMKENGTILVPNNLIQWRRASEVFTCASLLLLPPCSSLLLWLWSVTSDLAALSFGDDTVSAASETFIVSVSTVSDILIAQSYWEMLANTENLKETNNVREGHFLRQITDCDKMLG